MRAEFGAFIGACGAREQTIPISTGSDRGWTPALLRTRKGRCRAVGPTCQRWRGGPQMSVRGEGRRERPLPGLGRGLLGRWEEEARGKLGRGEKDWAESGREGRGGFGWVVFFSFKLFPIYFFQSLFKESFECN